MGKWSWVYDLTDRKEKDCTEINSKVSTAPFFYESLWSLVRRSLHSHAISISAAFYSNQSPLDLRPQQCNILLVVEAYKARSPFVSQGASLYLSEVECVMKKRQLRVAAINLERPLES